MTNVERQILLNQCAIMDALADDLLRKNQGYTNKNIEMLLECSKLSKESMVVDANCFDKIYTEEDL